MRSVYLHLKWGIHNVTNDFDKVLEGSCTRLLATCLPSNP